MSVAGSIARKADTSSIVRFPGVATLRGLPSFAALSCSSVSKGPVGASEGKHSAFSTFAP